jgi:hypothetical protein
MALGGVPGSLGGIGAAEMAGAGKKEVITRGDGNDRVLLVSMGREQCL